MQGGAGAAVQLPGPPGLCAGPTPAGRAAEGEDGLHAGRSNQAWRSLSTAMDDDLNTADGIAALFEHGPGYQQLSSTETRSQGRRWPTPSRRFDELTARCWACSTTARRPTDLDSRDRGADRPAAGRPQGKGLCQGGRHPRRAEGPDGHRAEGYSSGRTVDPYQVIRPENQPDIKTDRVCSTSRWKRQTRSVVFCGAGKQCGLVRCLAVSFQCDDESVSHRGFPECY